jgi:hypothetical protein
MKARVDHVAVELAPGRWYVRHRPSTRYVAGPFTAEQARINAERRDVIARRKRAQKKGAASDAR